MSTLMYTIITTVKILGLVLLFLISNVCTAFWAFEGAQKLAIDERIITYKGSIYSVTDTGEKYQTSRKE